MNKTEFVKHIKSELDCDAREATKLVDSFTKCLISALDEQLGRKQPSFRTF